jgi:hypothetical protein
MFFLERRAGGMAGEGGTQQSSLLKLERSENIEKWKRIRRRVARDKLKAKTGK